MCPFRKLDSKGKILAFSIFKGWDPLYWASKSEGVRKIMAARLSRVKDARIRLDGETLKKFLAAVAEAVQKAHSSRAPASRV